MNFKKIILATILLTAFSGIAFAAAPDMNVVYPNNSGLTLSGIITIDFNMLDADSNQSDMNIDINYSGSASQGTGTPILTDQNMGATSGLTCDSDDFSTVTQCHYTWNTASATDSTYYILINVNDHSDSYFDASNNPFTLLNNPPISSTTGSVDINLTPYGATVNSAAQLAENVTSGITTQGTLIGTVLGIIVALGFLIGLVGLVLSLLFIILFKINELKDQGKSI